MPRGTAFFHTTGEKSGIGSTTHNRAGTRLAREKRFLELPPLLSSRRLAALKTAAFRQGVTVGRLQKCLKKTICM
jgi:hypothetical protein